LAALDSITDIERAGILIVTRTIIGCIDDCINFFIAAIYSALDPVIYFRVLGFHAVTRFSITILFAIAKGTITAILGRTSATPLGTRIVHGTRILIVAGTCEICVGATCCRATGIYRTRILVIAKGIVRHVGNLVLHLVTLVNGAGNLVIHFRGRTNGALTRFGVTQFNTVAVQSIIAGDRRTTAGPIDAAVISRAEISVIAGAIIGRIREDADSFLTSSDLARIV